jgi:hypothetical protein
LLLGFGTGGGLTSNAFVAGQQIYRGYYVGDQFQISSRLTLNYGLRVEQMGPWSERFDRMVVLIPNEDNPVTAAAGMPLKGKFGLVNSPDRPSRNNMDLHNLAAPRLGLAYRLNNKTVIRTGMHLLDSQRCCLQYQPQQRSRERVYDSLRRNQ